MAEISRDLMKGERHTFAIIMAAFMKKQNLTRLEFSQAELEEVSPLMVLVRDTSEGGLVFDLKLRHIDDPPQTEKE